MKPNFYQGQQQQQSQQSSQQQNQQQLGSSPGRQQSQPYTLSQQQSQAAGLFSATNSMTHLKMLRQQQQLQAQQQLQQQSQQQRPDQNKTPNRAQNPQEFCGRHCEVNVGYLDSSKEMVCNQCIFEKKLLAVKFTALVSKDLRQEFNQAFAQYKQGKNQISGVDTDLVKQRAALLVQKFFAGVREKVKTMQRQSMSKIQQSDSLRELERIIEQSKEFMPSCTSGDHFEREKRLFDEKIGKGRFSYLVKRQDFYQDLIQSLEKSSEKMKQTIGKSSEQMERVLKMRSDENDVRLKLNQIVNECIEVDMNSMHGTCHSSPDTMKHNSTTQSSNQHHFQPQQQQQSPKQQYQTGTGVRQGFGNQSPQVNHQQQTHQQQQQQQQPQRNGFSPLHQTSQSPLQRMSPSPQHQRQQMASQSPQPVPNTASPAFSPAQPVVPQQPSPQPSPQQQQPQPIQQQAVAVAAPERTPPQAMSSPQNSPLANKPDIAPAKAASSDDNDCVIVTSVVPPTQAQGPHKLEHSFKSTFKLKGQILLKLIPGRGWVKIRDMQALMLAKSVQTLDETAYVIGGARDRNSSQTLSDVNIYQVRNGAVHTEKKADMLTSRSSHGATINVHKNEIYVAGGYHMGDLTKTCEAYNIATDTWRQLPPLNEPKCSVTLCTLRGKYLYCFGGLTKQESGAYLLNSIEVLDLDASQPKWLMLSVKMPHQVCDIGAVPLNDSDILLYGGWNKNPVNTSFVLRQTIRNALQMMHSFHPLSAQMDKTDFSMISGVAMKTADPDVVKVCCHAFLFAFNLKASAFVGSSSM